MTTIAAARAVLHAGVAERRDASSNWAIDRALPVLPAAMVVPGRGDRVPRVGDPTWSMHAGIARVNLGLSQYIVPFDRIGDHSERELTREFLYCAIHVDPKKEDIEGYSAFTPYSPGSIVSAYYDFKHFLSRVRESGLKVHEITQAWLDAWMASLKVDASTKQRRVQVVRRLYAYRNRLSFRVFGFSPWGMRATKKVVGNKRPRGENRTPRIPEHISGPMMRWALFYVDHAAEDVLRRLREMDDDMRASAMEPFAQAGALPKTGKAEARKRIVAYLERLRAKKRGIPLTAAGQISQSAMARALGLDQPSIQQNRDLIDAARLELGEDSERWSMLPGTEIPWVLGLNLRQALDELTRSLTACYLVAAFYSGMRDSETTDLRRKCVLIERRKDGSIGRYKVRGKLHKGQAPGGKKHTWVVIEPVAKALELAARIQDYVYESVDVRGTPEAKRRPSSLLFSTSLPRNYRFREGGHAPGDIEVASVRWTAAINAFQSHCNELAEAAAERLPGGLQATLLSRKERLLARFQIPGADGAFGGAPWHWTTKQLRRTLAWHIANQPFGVIAGKIQYGHASELMFEGYAGKSASGFRAEIEQEREFGRLDDIVADYENWHRGHAPAGPMGPRLAKGFEAVRNAIGDLPGAVIDVERRNRLLKNLARTVHPGFLNDCHWNKGTALCLARKRAVGDGPEADAPFWSKCDPEACPNSSVTRRHLPALLACKADAEEEMLKVKGQSPLQRRAVQGEIDRCGRLIARVSA